MFEKSQAFFKSFKQRKLDSKEEEWKKKASQGRIARADNNVSTLSSSHLVNLHLGDGLVSFVLRARLQLTERNSLLHFRRSTYSTTSFIQLMGQIPFLLCPRLCHI